MCVCLFSLTSNRARNEHTLPMLVCRLQLDENPQTLTLETNNRIEESKGNEMENKVKSSFHLSILNALVNVRVA